MKKITRRHHHLIVCLGVTAYFVVLMLTMYRSSFGGIAGAARQFWESLVAYFRFLIFLEQPTDSPIVAPPSGGDGTNVIPSDPNDFGTAFGEFMARLFSSNNFTAYLQSLEGFFINFVRILPFFILLIVLLQKRPLVVLLRFALWR